MVATVRCRMKLWTTLRFALSRMLSAAAVRRLAATCATAAQQLVARVRDEPQPGGPLDMEPCFADYVLTILFKLSFGLDLPRDEVRRNADSLLSRCENRILSTRWWWRHTRFQRFTDWMLSVNPLFGTLYKVHLPGA
jgi:cytochrome P450